MKKATMFIVLATTLVILGSCGSKDQTTTKSSDSSESVSTAESTKSENEMTPAIFSGTLIEDAKVNDDKETIRLVLENVEAIEDPEKIIEMMTSEGVILNASKESFSKGLDETAFLKGEQVQFTLKGFPIMTMSIPPQIPGNSITLIEKVAE